MLIISYLMVVLAVLWICWSLVIACASAGGDQHTQVLLVSLAPDIQYSVHLVINGQMSDTTLGLDILEGNTCSPL